MAGRKSSKAKATKPASKAGKPRRRRLILAAGGAGLVLVAGLAIGGYLLFGRDGGGEDADETEVAQQTRIVEPAPRPTSVVSFAQGCATAECHAGFLAERGVHEPARAGACDQCHLPDTGEHVYPMARGPEEMCLACHEGFAHKEFQHNALSSQGCTACHDPHKSDGPALLLAASVQATCAECHPAAGGKVTHAPYASGACVACHEPHESEFPGLLRGGAGMDHCGMCHESLVQNIKEMRHTHSAIEGECQACHDPHAADRASLLSLDAGTGCLQCHDSVRETIEGATVTHGAVMTGDRCVSCHNPHAADVPNMLADRQAAVCLDCHDEEVRGTDGRMVLSMATVLSAKVVHGPVKMDECSACHSVHGSTRARLLNELSPKVLYGGFDVRNYALCFQCHDQDMVLEERTTTGTQFRNGDVNLHHLHVAKAVQPESCTQCHSVHASDSPRLIAQKVPYQGSKWMMDMNFVIRADGGSCGPGCHETLSYSRELKALPQLPGGEP